jgi:hypothetical protein
MSAFPRMPRIFAGPTPLHAGSLAVVSVVALSEAEAAAILTAAGATSAVMQIGQVATVPLYCAVR